MAHSDEHLRIVLIFAQGCSNWSGEMEGEVCRLPDCGCLKVVRTLRSEIEAGMKNDSQTASE